MNNILSVLPQINKCGIYRYKKITQICLSVGEDLSKTAKQNNGMLNIENLNTAYRKVLPKKSTIEVTDSLQNSKDFLKKSNFSDEIISNLERSAQAFVVKNLKGKTLFFIPIKNFSSDKAVNVATHEFEHVLNLNHTVKAKFSNLFLKALGQKRVEKIALKNTAIMDEINLKNIALQQKLMEELTIFNPLSGTNEHSADIKGLLQYLGLSSEKRLQVTLRKDVRSILNPNSEKKNIKSLKVIKKAITDEQRAYSVGGKVAKEYLGLKEGSTSSEMLSQVYKKSVDVINKEIESQRIKRIKRFFGFKVRNYEGNSDSSAFMTRAIPQDEIPDDILEKLLDCILKK